MEFDPSHTKWQCCCCLVSTGVQLFGAFEMLLGFVILCLITPLVAAGLSAHIILGLVGKSMIINILWLFFGAATLANGLLQSTGVWTIMPFLLQLTLLIRPLCIVMVQVLVVLRLLSHHADESDTIPLVVSILVVIFGSVIIIYSSYMLVLCVRFLEAKNRYQQRRESVIRAGQFHC